ncbi:MAG: histidine kinase dimerization/phospho-acceptor domain-containing protein [Candidatus Omnitrophota bacterium]
MEKEKKEMQSILDELKENPYQKFNIAFALMSIIPFLTFFYLLAARLFTIHIFAGDIGLLLAIALFISLCGLVIGYGLLKHLLQRLISYAANARRYSELKSTFVATVSHEFRTPLYQLSSNIKNILEGMPDQVGLDARKTLEECRAEMDRMWDLSTRLLDIYKIEE